EALPDPRTIDLGLFLLGLSEDTIGVINKGIRQITAKAKADGKKHDVTLPFATRSAGLTIHCNPFDPMEIAENVLRIHCQVRKYSQEATRWFGLALRPD